MKKYILPIIILIAFIVLIAYFYFNKFNFNDEIDHNANRLSTEVENSTGLNNDISKEPVVVEEEISNFSTKIIDDDDNRDTNIRITCNEINGTMKNFHLIKLLEILLLIEDIKRLEYL